MTTSAQQLNELLSPVSRAAPSITFLAAVSNRLDLEGDDAEMRALEQVYNTARNVKSDIDLSDDPELKNRATQLFKPFSPLLKFSGYHLNIQQAKGNFLKPENMVGLTDLHLMLKGVTARPELPLEESKELAAEFALLKDKVVACEGLPDGFKEALLKRLNQVSSAFDHFFAFGEEGLERELEALIGSIFLHVYETPADNVPLLKEVWDKVGQGFGLLRSINDKAGTFISLSEKGQKLLEFFANS